MSVVVDNFNKLPDKSMIMRYLAKWNLPISNDVL